MPQQPINAPPFCFLFFIIIPQLCKYFNRFASKSRRRRVYHPQLVAVYHQHEVLYIIKPQEDARWRVMRYKGGLPPLMICTALRAAMICQACGLDKKIRILTNADFLAGAEGLGLVATPQSRTLDFAFATLLGPRGSDSPPDCHSFPLVQVLLSQFPPKQKGHALRTLFVLCCHYKTDPYKAIVQKQSVFFAARVHLSLGDDGNCTRPLSYGAQRHACKQIYVITTLAILL